MKRVKVMSLTDCFDYVVNGAENDTIAIISIQKSDDRGYGFRFIENSRCKGVLTLLFDDIDRPVDGMVAFTEEHARQIIAFIAAQRRKADTLLIHCFAGQSRSRAVGAFAAKMLGGNNLVYFSTGVPNPLVYSTLIRVFDKMKKKQTVQ